MAKLTESKVLASARASSLKNVKNLNCWGSDIDDLSILKKLPNLEVLNLSVNHVSELKDLAYCPKLKEVYLRKNDLADLSEIAYLKHLPCLRVLWLSENPCTTAKNYRATVLCNLPDLNKLDNCEINEQERNISTPKGEMFSSCLDLPDFSKLDLSITLQEDEISNLLSTVQGINGNEDDDSCESIKETGQHKYFNQENVHQSVKQVYEKESTQELHQQSRELSFSSNRNVLSASLLLLNELDAGGLKTLIEEAENRLSDLKSKESREAITE